MKILSQNRKAHHQYHVLEREEAGIQLQGSEVKALRLSRMSLDESFIIERDGELFLHNAHIPPYAYAQNHEPRRNRKLLLKRRQLNKIIGQITRKGMTAIPLKVYLNAKGWIKVEIALAVGLKKVDRRQVLKEKEWKRTHQRLFKKEMAS